MKITILQGAFLPIPPVLGGATEKMWYALAKEFCRSGHRVVYVSRAFEGMPEEELVEGILYKRVKGYDWPRSIFKLKWLDLLYTLRAKEAVPPDSDVVVTNTFWAPLLLPTQLKRRTMVDVARIPKGQMKLYYQSARLRANSTPVARAIRQELPENQHQRVTFIPNPLPFENLLPVDFKSKKPVMLYTGRVHPEKGLHLLIEAYKELGSPWELKIVGPWEKAAGGGGKSYLQYLKKIAGGVTITFTGPVHDPEELNKYYAEASIFVYPSVAEQGESFGLAPLEAMSWGCVPIVSDLPCFQDFIEHGKNGLIFNHRREEAARMLKESMDFLISDAVFTNHLAEKALQVRKSHSTSFIASLFLKEFEGINDQPEKAKPVFI